MIVKEYCESMERQLAAWRTNIEMLLIIAETARGSTTPANMHRQQENLQSLIEDIGRVTKMLKDECLVA